MKYIANETTFVAWFAAARRSHQDMATAAKLVPTNAGFLQFGATESTARSYGKSGTLNLSSRPLDLSCVLFVGLDSTGYPVLSNDEAVLSSIAPEYEAAVWTLSGEGFDGNCPVVYPTGFGQYHSVDEVNAQ